jgi:hypothetical protein
MGFFLFPFFGCFGENREAGNTGDYYLEYFGSLRYSVLCPGAGNIAVFTYPNVSFSEDAFECRIDTAVVRPFAECVSAGGIDPSWNRGKLGAFQVAQKKRAAFYSGGGRWLKHCKKNVSVHSGDTPPVKTFLLAGLILFLS